MKNDTNTTSSDLAAFDLPDKIGTARRIRRSGMTALAYGASRPAEYSTVRIFNTMRVACKVRRARSVRVPAGWGAV